MIALLGERYDLEIYLEDNDLHNMKGEVLEGMLLREEGNVVPITFGLDDTFAAEKGNRRVGAHFEGKSLDIRLSQAAYRELVSDKIFAERYTLRDGSKICVCLAHDPRHSLDYVLLQAEIVALEGFGE